MVGKTHEIIDLDAITTVPISILTAALRMVGVKVEPENVNAVAGGFEEVEELIRKEEPPGIYIVTTVQGPVGAEYYKVENVTSKKLYKLIHKLQAIWEAVGEDEDKFYERLAREQ